MTNNFNKDELKTRPFAQMLKDVWWSLNTKEGKEIPLYGTGGKVVGKTSQEDEASWAAENHARTIRAIGDVATKVDNQGKALAAGATVNVSAEIDYDLLANKVADKLAARLNS